MDQLKAERQQTQRHKIDFRTARPAATKTKNIPIYQQQ